MGPLSHVACEVGASWVRVSKTFLDTSMAIAAGGADKDNP
jgi:hypothetical protein